MSEIFYRFGPAATLNARKSSFPWTRCHSWTYNQVARLSNLFAEPTAPAGRRLTEIGGGIVLVPATVNPYLCLSAVGDDALGIVLGSAPASTPWQSHRILVPITQGGADQQMFFQDTQVAAPGIFPQSLTISREFLSPTLPFSTSIQELALYCTDGTDTFCFIYDSFTQPVIASDGMRYLAQYLVKTV